VRSVADVRNHLDELKMVTVPSSKLGTVPWTTWFISSREPGRRRSIALHATREVTISCNLAPNTSEQMVLDEIAVSVKKLDMGPDYTTGLLGKSKEMAKMQKAFLRVFILAFIFVYLCIAAQFESWLHPITILLSLPLTLPFALVSLSDFSPVAQYLFALGHSRAICRGQEKLDFAD